MTPAIGSRWRSKRNGRIGTAFKPGYGCVLLHFDADPRRRWVRLVDGRPCGYEAVEEGKEGEG